MYAQTRNIPLLLLTDVSPYAKIREKVHKKKKSMKNSIFGRESQQHTHHQTARAFDASEW